MLTRKLIFLLLALPLLLPSLSMAQSQIPDTVYVFRFVSHEDMFYTPWKDNSTQLDHLLSLVENHKTAILSGASPLLVDGYCASEPTAVENMRLAKIRSNRVKSELILSKGVNESCFITRNHAEPYGDLRHVVIVRLRLPKEEAKQDEPKQEDPVIKEQGNPVITQDSPKQETSAASTSAALSAASSDLQSDVSEYQDFQSASAVSSVSSYPSSHPFSLRANLLHWATLTPDLGLEWRVHRHVSILVNGSWTSWSWDNKNRRYALWKVSPEVRYYLGKQGKGFLGVLYHTGEFHYKLGKTGRQGDYQGGGLTGGYLLDLNRALSLDFHAGLGYTRSEYDQYKVVESTRVRQGSETKNYWGINQLGITLVWKLIK